MDMIGPVRQTQAPADKIGEIERDLMSLIPDKETVDVKAKIGILTIRDLAARISRSEGRVSIEGGDFKMEAGAGKISGSFKGKGFEASILRNTYPGKAKLDIQGESYLSRILKTQEGIEIKSMDGDISIGLARDEEKLLISGLPGRIKLIIS